jgi:flagellar basal body-associated protein FliL
VNGEGERPRRAVVILFLLVLAAAAAALWLPRWWENRLYRQAEALTGVGSPVLSGSVTDARRKIDPGRTEKQVVAALGRPSFSTGTEGTSTHAIWIYYYGDGTLTVNLTDDVVVRIGIGYGPPVIPTSRRR